MERSTLTGVTSQVGKKVSIFAGPLAWLWLLAFCAGTGVAAVLWLTTLPPLPECKQPQSLSFDADKLFCVEQDARSGDVNSLIAGLDLVRDWSADHPLYTRAQNLMEKWSVSVLDLARMKVVEADLKGAIALAEKIPPSSPIYKDARAAITTWQKDINQGQAIIDSIQAAMKARNWALATQQIRALSQMGSDYWLQHIERLRQQISAEEIAADHLQKARLIVKQSPRDLQALGRAIALAEQINPDTYAYKAGKAEIERWMATLYGIVAGRLSTRTNLEGATAVVQKLPRGIPVPDVRDILWFSRAQSLTADPLPRGPLYQQLWQLWMTFSQLGQIQPTSPLYSQTKALLPKLQTQIQDVTQLNLASVFASLGQIPTFQLAIQVAQGITPERPRRIYAQTLISMWQKDIERVQDSPYLAQAQRYAVVGKPEALKQAIAYARQIAPGRPLHPQAQAAIAQWNRQIQLIEDEPILKQAQTLAKQQRRDEAIQVASRIRPGRALYHEAQTAISSWLYDIQIAEDQPLLDRAYTLAAAGKTAAAINLASQIRPGRALYGEAQGAIATWTAQQKRNQPPIPLEEDDRSANPLNSFSSPSPDPIPDVTLPPSTPLPSSLPQASSSPLASPAPVIIHTPQPQPSLSPSPDAYPVESYEVLPPPNH